MTALFIGQCVLLVCVALGTACWFATLILAFLFRRRRPWAGPATEATLPPATLFKPVYGLERNLQQNLRTACTQDYPNYEVIFSVQREDDPAIPLLRELEAEFGRERACVAVESVAVGRNGKINNLCGALRHARHDVFVISDSDVLLKPDFLRNIVAPLADPRVGAVTTFFRATGAERWYEKLEQLNLNADQFAAAMFASATKLVDFCFGVSTAFTRETLERIGGFEAFGQSLVEDTEMGRRITALGRKLVVIPYVVDMTVDLDGPRAWIQKQIYWDRNTLAAVPAVFAASFCLRVIPLALLLAALRGFDAAGLAVLSAATVVRLAAAGAVLGVALRDRPGVRSLWLVPLKDVLGVVWSLRAVFSRTVVWRGVELSVDKGGRLAPLGGELSRERAS